MVSQHGKEVRATGRKGHTHGGVFALLINPIFTGTNSMGPALIPSKGNVPSGLITLGPLPAPLYVGTRKSRAPAHDPAVRDTLPQAIYKA